MISDIEKIKAILERLDFDEFDFQFIESLNLYCINKGFSPVYPSNMLDTSNIWWLERIMKKNFCDEETFHYILQYFNVLNDIPLHNYHPKEKISRQSSKNINRQLPKTKEGYLYVAQSESMQGIIKIGYTTKSITSRMKQLSPKTSVPKPFKCLWYEKVYDCIEAEKQAHEELSKYRIDETEFFKIDSEQAITACSSVLDRVLL